MFTILITQFTFGQTETINSGDLKFTGNRDNAISLNGDNTANKPMLIIGEQQRYGVGFKWDSGLNLDIVQFDNQDIFSTNPTKLGHFRVRDKVFYWEGNVGIGTTNPNQKLSIQGNDASISVSQSTYNYSISTPIGAQLGAWDGNYTNAAGIKFHRWRGTANSFANAYIGQAKVNGQWGLDFRVENQTSASNPTQSRMFIKPDGNVGIGTTNPDMKLTVKGNIHAEEVKIDLNVPVPDYVFKSDYKLRSIEEVENFIKEHSHLPEIPSAEEFAKNGVMQAEMDMNLLKKIEELTLYTIEQEKKIKSLEKQTKEIQELKTLIKQLLKDKN